MIYNININDHVKLIVMNVFVSEIYFSIISYSDMSLIFNFGVDVLTGVSL